MTPERNSSDLYDSSIRGQQDQPFELTQASFNHQLDSGGFLLPLDEAISQGFLSSESELTTVYAVE